MATCLSYAKLAYAAYFTSTAPYFADPPGHMVDDWTVQKWETGTLFGNGFQGGIYQDDHDVVVSCCGTNPGQAGAFLSDLSADLRIGLKILPNQSTSALSMVKVAQSIAAGRRVSVTGHSLGGGLAQVAGLWGGVPFVTFNAPAMASAIKGAKYNILKPQMMLRTRNARSVAETAGLNFRIAGDRVSMHGIAGEHVGMVVDLAKRYAHMGAHGKATCWQAILESDWAEIDPFEAL